MGKRFTATEKWSDKWFRALSADNKLAWSYITDRCDAAGVIDLDRELADFQIGKEIDWEGFLTATEGRVRVIQKGKWLIVGFIKFQYGRLSRDCKPHLPVLNLVAMHGLDLSEIEQNDAYRAGKIDPGRKARVLARDSSVCCYCGYAFQACDLETDHVIPVALGGDDSVGNLVASCRPCNQSKNDKHPTDFINSLPDSEVIWERLSQRVSERLLESLKEKEQDKEKEKETDKEGGAGETKSARRKFVKPTEAEVRGYCQDRRYVMDAEDFCDFYESKGWKVGDQPMKDWKAAVRRWHRNGGNRGSPSKSKSNAHAQEYQPTEGGKPSVF